MHRKTLSGAIGVAIGTAAFAIMTGQPVGAQQAQSPATPGQTGAPSSAQTGRTSADQQVTMTGCIQSEADYRRSTNAGGGGVANTGVGVGNEFVLVNAMMSTGSSASASSAPAAGSTRGTTGTTGAAGTTAAGGSTTGAAGGSTATGGSTAGATSSAAGATSSAAGAGTAYELTGSREGDAAKLVGKRVEITGTLKPATSATAGGPTANAPLSQDLQLREFEVASVRETTGTCAATPAR